MFLNFSLPAELFGHEVGSPITLAFLGENTRGWGWLEEEENFSRFLHTSWKMVGEECPLSRRSEEIWKSLSGEKDLRISSLGSVVLGLLPRDKAQVTIQRQGDNKIVTVRKGAIAAHFVVLVGAKPGEGPGSWKTLFLMEFDGEDGDEEFLELQKNW